MIFGISALVSVVLATTYDDYLNDVKDNSDVCDCPCEDKRDGTCRFHTDYCYTPVCTQGHYLCCGTCSMSTCQFKLNYEISTRELRECIQCPAGHYCPGCDLPILCPLGTYNVKLAQNKEENCLSCPRDYESNNARTACCTIVGSATYYALGSRVVCTTDPVEVDPATVQDAASFEPTAGALILLAAAAALLT